MTWFDPAPFGWSRSTRRCRREAASETGIINRALYLLFSLPPLHSPAPAGAWDFAACAGWRRGAGAGAAFPAVAMEAGMHASADARGFDVRDCGAYAGRDCDRMPRRCPRL